MAGLFKKEKASCAVCNKEITHKHKPKKGWNVEGVLCGNCYVDLLGENFKKDSDDRCVLCGAEPGSFSLWRPKKEWGVPQGWLCKPCFDEKEKADDEAKKYCAMCGAKIGFFCYSPRKGSGIKGQICKACSRLPQGSDDPSQAGGSSHEAGK